MPLAGKPLEPPGRRPLGEDSFPQATLFFSAARPGPEGGPQGGAAILLPSTWEVQDATVLVSACALQVTARQRTRGSPAIRLHCVYFPP